MVMMPAKWIDMHHTGVKSHQLIRVDPSCIKNLRTTVSVRTLFSQRHAKGRVRRRSEEATSRQESSTECKNLVRIAQNLTTFVLNIFVKAMFKAQIHKHRKI